MLSEIRDVPENATKKISNQKLCNPCNLESNQIFNIDTLIQFSMLVVYNVFLCKCSNEK